MRKTANNKVQRRQKQNKAGVWCIILVMLMLIVVIAIQGFGLYKKNKDYMKQEAKLKKQYEEELENQADIELYEEYVQTNRYIEEIAKEKLGLVYDNEIIFRAK